MPNSFTQRFFDMPNFETQDIRNVALIGHAGCGKTTLAEAMLYEAKAINRRGSVASSTTPTKLDCQKLTRFARKPEFGC